MALTDSDKQSIQQLLSRDATAVELAIFDTMWSEHCSYKSSKPVLKTLPTDGPNILLGVGEDSGIIEFAKHNGTRTALLYRTNRTIIHLRCCLSKVRQLVLAVWYAMCIAWALM